MKLTSVFITLAATLAATAVAAPFDPAQLPDNINVWVREGEATDTEEPPGMYSTISLFFL